MIDQADATIRATWPSYTKYVHGDVFICTVTIPNSTAAFGYTAASVNIDGTSSTSQSIPQSQVWRLDDLYTNSAGDTNIQAVAQFTKNKIKTLAVTANLATQVVSNQTRPGLPAVFIYEPQSSLQVNVAPTVAVTAGGSATNTFYVTAVIYDSSFG